MLALLGSTPATQGSAPPPASGPPTNVSSYYYGGSLIGIQWDTGDASASTRIFYKASSGGCPSSLPADATLLGTVGPGVTFFETGQTGTCNYFIAHYAGGSYSDFVQSLAGASSSCSACPL